MYVHELQSVRKRPKCIPANVRSGCPALPPAGPTPPHPNLYQQPRAPAAHDMARPRDSNITSFPFMHVQARDKERAVAWRLTPAPCGHVDAHYVRPRGGTMSLRNLLGAHSDHPHASSRPAAAPANRYRPHGAEPNFGCAATSMPLPVRGIRGCVMPRTLDRMCVRSSFCAPRMYTVHWCVLVSVAWGRACGSSVG